MGCHRWTSSKSNWRKYPFYVVVHDLGRWRRVRACGLGFPLRCNTERPLSTVLDNLTDSLSLSLLLSGNALLRAEVAVEKLGGGKDYGTEDGPRPRDHLGGRAEAEEEDAH